MCLLFAATYPDRCTGLIIASSYDCRAATDAEPWGLSPEQFDTWISSIRTDWGGPVGLEVRAPSMAGDSPIASGGPAGCAWEAVRRLPN